MIRIITSIRLPDGELVDVFYNPKTRTISDEGGLVAWSWETDRPVPPEIAKAIPTAPLPLEQWDYEAAGWEVSANGECRHFESIKGAVLFAGAHPGAIVREQG